jgi:hypothetical protein
MARAKMRTATNADDGFRPSGRLWNHRECLDIEMPSVSIVREGTMHSLRFVARDWAASRLRGLHLARRRQVGVGAMSDFVMLTVLTCVATERIQEPS